MARFEDLEQLDSPEDYGDAEPGEGTVEEAEPVEKPESGTGESGYRGGEVRCFNCAHFEDPSDCAKGVNGGTVDPDGSCDQFSMAQDGEEAEEGGEMDSGEGGPEEEAEDEEYGDE